jgi:hypothetical protein
VLNAILHVNLVVKALLNVRLVQLTDIFIKDLALFHALQTRMEHLLNHAKFATHHAINVLEANINV